MALTGFDPDLVSSSIKAVQAAREELIIAIADEMQNKFVNGMQDKWACNQAIKFFESFKNTMDSLILQSINTFESVIQSMDSAAKAWAMQTDSVWPGVQFPIIDKKIDVSMIKENIAGVRGVDPEAKAVSSNLTTIATSANIALSNAQSAVQTCGFIGGGSAEQLISSLGKIKTSIDEAVTQISEACKAAIESTTQEYTNLEVKVSDAFAGTQAGAN